MAVAMVQPGRQVGLVKASSVRKKLKDRSFARRVLREDITLGSEELGVEVGELVELVVAALSPIATELGLGGAE
jgi:predicted hydrolase (HD superfamily)